MPESSARAAGAARGYGIVVMTLAAPALVGALTRRDATATGVEPSPVSAVVAGCEAC